MYLGNKGFSWALFEDTLLFSSEITFNAGVKGEMAMSFKPIDLCIGSNRLVLPLCNNSVSYIRASDLRHELSVAADILEILKIKNPKNKGERDACFKLLEGFLSESKFKDKVNFSKIKISDRLKIVDRLVLLIERFIKSRKNSITRLTDRLNERPWGVVSVNGEGLVRYSVKDLDFCLENDKLTSNNHTWTDATYINVMSPTVGSSGKNIADALLAFAKECKSLREFKEGMFRTGALRSPFVFNLTRLTVELPMIFELKQQKIANTLTAFVNDALINELTEMELL